MRDLGRTKKANIPHHLATLLDALWHLHLDVNVSIDAIVVATSRLGTLDPRVSDAIQAWARGPRFVLGASVLVAPTSKVRYSREDFLGGILATVEAEPYWDGRFAGEVEFPLWRYPIEYHDDGARDHIFEADLQ